MTWSLWTLGCLLVFTSTLVRQATGQANYVDPFRANQMNRCSYFNAGNTNSADWNDPSSKKCSTDIDLCPGDVIHLSQCWGGGSTVNGDAVARLCIKSSGATLGYDDDACGERRGGFFTHTYGGSICRNATIVDGCFGDKFCDGFTNFIFFSRTKRCGFGHYRSGSNCLPVQTGK